MKISIASIAFVVAGAIAAASPAAARVKHPAKPHCVDQPFQLSWNFLGLGDPARQPNGCSPPVYQNGQFVGQDPDPNIRFQLMRDPATGYGAGNY
jgi:hypothetical protein